MLRMLARFVLRHEIEALIADRDRWKSWALVQERYRKEMHGELASSRIFRDWFFQTYPKREDLPN